MTFCISHDLSVVGNFEHGAAGGVVSEQIVASFNLTMFLAAMRQIYWLPPTPEEVAHTGRLGERGEALVYRMELERVRGMGYEEPERYVVWTSRNEPGDDHYIRIYRRGGPTTLA